MASSAQPHAQTDLPTSRPFRNPYFLQHRSFKRIVPSGPNALRAKPACISMTLISALNICLIGDGAGTQ